MLLGEKNQTEKSNSFSTIKVPFVSNEIECPVMHCYKIDKRVGTNDRRQRPSQPLALIR